MLVRVSGEDVCVWEVEGTAVSEVKIKRAWDGSYGQAEQRPRESRGVMTERERAPPPPAEQENHVLCVSVLLCVLSIPISQPPTSQTCPPPPPIAHKSLSQWYTHFSFSDWLFNVFRIWLRKRSVIYLGPKQLAAGTGPSLPSGTIPESLAHVKSPRQSTRTQRTSVLVPSATSWSQSNGWLRRPENITVLFKNWFYTKDWLRLFPVTLLQREFIYSWLNLR